MGDFITKHDTKQEFDKVAKTAQEQDMAMKEAAKANYVPISSDSDRDSSEEDRARGQSFNVKHGISDATLNAIQYKQGVQKELRQKSQDTIEVETKQKKIDLLVKVAEMVRSQFQCAQGSTLYFGKVVTSMLDSHRGNFVSKDRLKEQITTLCKILPQWLQVKQHSQGELMKCHKHMKLSGHDIKVKITEYFSDDSGKPSNSQDQRLSKSCPPVQATQHTTAVTPHQMGAPAHHQAPSSAFKPSSAF